MRSRYSAFVVGAVDWIVDSHHSETVDEVNRDEIESWSRDSEWLGLRIRDVTDGGEHDDDGVVHFRARYRTQGQQIDHVERAKFLREGGDWRFHSVLVDEPEHELVPVAPRSTVGRNDPCTCGSGKKYKKCCGA